MGAEFWFGVLVGLFVGANVGILVLGLLAGAKKSENYSEWGLHETQIND